MEIKTYCTDCGNELVLDIKPALLSIQLTVEPCFHCTETTRKEGWDEGHEAGYSEGLVVENNNDIYRS